MDCNRSARAVSRLVAATLAWMLLACGDDLRQSTNGEDTTTSASSLPDGACGELRQVVDLSHLAEALPPDPDRPVPLEVSVADAINVGFQQVAPLPPAWREYDAIVYVQDGSGGEDVRRELQGVSPGLQFDVVSPQDYVAELEEFHSTRPRLLPSLGLDEVEGDEIRVKGAGEDDLRALADHVEQRGIGFLEEVDFMFEMLDRLAPAQLPRFLEAVEPQLRELSADGPVASEARALLDHEVRSVADADALRGSGDALLDFAEQECGIELE
jgi:hypothetical protein